MGRQGAIAMNGLISKKVEQLLSSVDVLVVDDNQFMRKVIRNILTNIGIKGVREAADGLAGLEHIRQHARPGHHRRSHAHLPVAAQQQHAVKRHRLPHLHPEAFHLELVASRNAVLFSACL